MLKATLYKRPNGHRSEVDVTDIEPADEKYLTENNVELSMEDLPPGLIGLYGKYGPDPEDEALVVVKFSSGCRAGMTKLVESIKRLKGEGDAAREV